MGDAVCSLCGLSHSRLGVVICGDTLTRTAHSSRGQVLTRLGAASPAWAFFARLLDAHTEIKKIEIHDEDTGESFAVDRETFARFSFRRTLPQGGEQVILSFKYWRVASFAS